MILTDYYKMREIRECKSHRFDCVASTGEYEPFERIAQRSKVNRFFFYYNGVPDTFSMNAQRKADRVITNCESISSVYVPELETPLRGYGDTKNTNDCLLFLFSEDYKQIEVFVARGYKHDSKGLYYSFADGERDGEMEILRKRAKPTNV